MSVPADTPADRPEDVLREYFDGFVPMGVHGKAAYDALVALVADNQRLTAEVAQAVDQSVIWMVEKGAAEADLTTLREALAFYAEGKHYGMQDDSGLRVLNDYGEVARTALDAVRDTT